MSVSIRRTRFPLCAKAMPMLIRVVVLPSWAPALVTTSVFTGLSGLRNIRLVRIVRQHSAMLLFGCE